MSETESIFNPARPCPRCGQAAAYATRPFCSERCQMVDLGKWLNEDYRVATEESEDNQGD